MPPLATNPATPNLSANPAGAFAPFGGPMLANAQAPAQPPAPQAPATQFNYLDAQGQPQAAASSSAVPGQAGYVSEGIDPKTGRTGSGDVFNAFKGYVGPQGGTFGAGAPGRSAFEGISGVSADKLGDTANWTPEQWAATTKHFGGIANGDQASIDAGLTSDNQFLKDTATAYKGGYGSQGIEAMNRDAPIKAANEKAFQDLIAKGNADAKNAPSDSEPSAPAPESFDEFAGRNDSPTAAGHVITPASQAARATRRAAAQTASLPSSPTFSKAPMAINPAPAAPATTAPGLAAAFAPFGAPSSGGPAPQGTGTVMPQAPGLPSADMAPTDGPGPATGPSTNDGISKLPDGIITEGVTGNDAETGTFDPHIISEGFGIGSGSTAPFGLGSSTFGGAAPSGIGGGLGAYDPYNAGRDPRKNGFGQRSDPFQGAFRRIRSQAGPGTSGMTGAQGAPENVI